MLKQKTKTRNFIRALKLVRRCEKRGTSLTALAAEDGFTRSLYSKIVADAGLIPRYKLSRKANTKQQNILLKIDFVKNSTGSAYKKEDARERAQELVNECVRTNTYISNLARRHGVQPAGYISRLVAAGLYDDYKRLMKVPKYYKVCDRRIQRGKEVLDRCKKLKLSYSRLAKKDGYASDSVYYRLLISSGYKDAYDVWRKEFKINKLQRELEL